MKKVIGLAALAVILAGCQSDAPLPDTSKKNADGEVEGNAPQFVLVPAQGDPNNPNRK